MEGDTKTGPITEITAGKRDANTRGVEMLPPRKRPRTLSTANSSPLLTSRRLFSTRSGARHAFLPFHLELLQTLYQRAAAVDDNDDDTEKEEDIQLVWGPIQEYLQRRDQIEALDGKVQKYRVILEETKDFQQENDSMWKKQRPAVVTNPSAWRSSLLSTRSSSPSLRNSFLTSSQEVPPVSLAYGLVAALFRQEHTQAVRVFRKTVGPFQILLDQVQGILRDLQASNPSVGASDKADDNNNDNALESSKRSEEQEEDVHARWETKRQLWELLRSDLLHELDERTS